MSPSLDASKKGNISCQQVHTNKCAASVVCSQARNKKPGTRPGATSDPHNAIRRPAEYCFTSGYKTNREAIVAPISGLIKRDPTLEGVIKRLSMRGACVNWGWDFGRGDAIRHEHRVAK